MTPAKFPSDGTPSSFANLLLEFVADDWFSCADEVAIEPAGTAVRVDLHAADVARAACGSDRRFEGHGHRDRGTGNSGVEVAAVGDLEDNPVLDVPVTVHRHRNPRQTPSQTSARVSSERSRRQLKAGHLHTPPQIAITACTVAHGVV